MDEEELRQALQVLHTATFGWALDCCDRRREDAEDVLHGSYVKILNGAARFDGRSSLKTFLFGVIRRTAAEERRRRWMRSLAFARWFRSQPSERRPNDPESAARKSEQSRQLVTALARLPRRQRELVHLVFYQDCTVEEAARVLGISVGAARTHFDRGKKRLRRLLGAEAGPR
ncbi:MAG: RNA polymerase sigma factor [Vicinamibacterales bacterium]